MCRHVPVCRCRPATCGFAARPAVFSLGLEIVQKADSTFFDPCLRLSTGNLTLRCAAQEPLHVVCALGLVLVVRADGLLSCLKEKDLMHKLDALLTRHPPAFPVALSLLEWEGVRACSCFAEGLG